MKDAAVEEHLGEIAGLAPEGFNFGFHVRYSRPTLIRLTYSTAWSQVYSEKKFILCDPTVVWSLLNEGATRWSAIELSDPLGVMETAAKHGYPYGVAIGCGETASKTIGSCGRSDREFSDSEIEQLTYHVFEVHRLLEKGPRLKQHHIDALSMLEQGRTYDESCEELGISRTAFRSRLSVSRKALGAKNNTDAVRIAVERGILTSTSYTGVTKALPSEG